MAFEDLGPNSGFIEDLYDRYLEAPGTVPSAWGDYFTDLTSPGGTAHTLSTNGHTGNGAPPAAESSPTSVETPPPVGQQTGEPSTAPSGEPAAETLTGSAAVIAQNMTASLSVPTATSVHTVPARLLELNRETLNHHLEHTTGAKISFTHLVAFAVVRALSDFPVLNDHFELVDGKAGVVHHAHVNLGLAIDTTRPDGGHTLLVPNIREAETLEFAAFWRAYEAVVRKVRERRMSPDDFQGTTATITNPGMLGTEQSVPRLMPGQGFIVGIGSIGLPAEYEGADPEVLARIGVGPVMALTNTYDHRIISGAESGQFLQRIHELLIGEDTFYDDVFRSLAAPGGPARWTTDHAPTVSPTSLESDQKVVDVQTLINTYRVRGHLVADLDPLGRDRPRTYPELDITHYDLSIWDLEREFPIGSLGAGQLGRSTMKLQEILDLLGDAYAGRTGIEYMHIQEPEQKAWIQRAVEVRQPPVSLDTKRRILEKLNAAEVLERFLHTKYLGQKRFSLEGAETLIPMLDTLCSAAADAGIPEIVMGMTHRGRLNVLANVLARPYGQIFREFEDVADPSSSHGSGDVKYHLGSTGTHRAPSGAQIALTLVANPSHLEAVDPVVEGVVRAVRDRGDGNADRTLPVLVHGDAAFAGQGVVAETFNLSEVDGYDVGGTVHLVVDNQLGFTTAPESGRSSVYATDVAKMIQAPIFHVNGDDPEAAVAAIRLAFEFRQQFQHDVVVDLVCYRRYGHNETDEPSFTQPTMYALIDAHPTVRSIYTDLLVRTEQLPAGEADAVLADYRTQLDRAFVEMRQASSMVSLTAAGDTPAADVRSTVAGTGAPTPEARSTAADIRVRTRVDRGTLERVVDGISTWPDGFHVHPKLQRILASRRTAFDADAVDWALAEALAFGSLVLEGTAVRLAGQDTRRGTFSQRHGVLVDQVTEAEHVPLAHLAPDQAPYRIYDSVLSEYAALGFEYGYSVGDPASLVLWEAQFGDFANAAQVVIDEFVVAAGDKWGQHSGLVLLLPHGLEGQGPDHSSARIERFLAASADGALRVVQPTTAAQYFHALRRQAGDPTRIPLVCLTPKGYLRRPETRSPVSAFTDESFHRVREDPSPQFGTLFEDHAIRRVVVCSGKVAYELAARRDAANVPCVIVRVEQLAPWPAHQVTTALARFPNASRLCWVQEEPENMGAWNFVRSELETLLRPGMELRCVARPKSASPASGSTRVHDREQAALLDAVLAGT